MLELTIGGEELYDEATNTFSTTETVVLQFEHSLVTLSKWESKFEKPFLDQEDKTNEEVMEYIACMFISPGEFSEHKDRLNQSHLNQINDYINSKQSATIFSDIQQGGGGRGEKITAELIYYWMVIFHIPFECETWHVNRLFTLVRVCNLKQQKPKKQNAGDAARQRAELNAKRKAQYNTSG